MIEVLFFASLREQLQCEKFMVVDFQGQSIADLKIHLFTLNPHWRDIFLHQQLLSAVNQTLASASTHIANNDEVAFFPKVTGG